MNTLDIFFEPASLFKNLNSRPTWLGPFLVVSLLVIVCTLLMFPVMEHLMLKQLPVGISAEQQAQMLSSLKMSRKRTPIQRLPRNRTKRIRVLIPFRILRVIIQNHRRF